MTLQTVRESNARLKDFGPGLVAIFVGGTSGIGETTAREFARNCLEPRLYLVGRNKKEAVRIIKELQGLNPGGKYKFVSSDVSLLRSVDVSCEEIKKDEEAVNLLFISAGIATMSGRDETSEGLDRKFSLHYYSRMRFIMNMTPQLTAASRSGGLSRVVSILGPGDEGSLILSDLALNHHYSVKNCLVHAVTMNSLAVGELASANPKTTFIHAYPGLVKTNIAHNLGTVARWASDLFMFFASPWMVDITECGERHLFAATSASYPPREGGKYCEATAIGSDGTKGSGAYLLGWDGSQRVKERILRNYQVKGIGKQVWEHTLSVFNKVC